MPNINPILLLALIVYLVQGNVWDNIFSQTLASSPIILSESLNFKFPINYNDMEFQGSVDFNSQLKVLTVTASKAVFALSFDVFSLQVDLDQLLLTISSVLSGCEKYRLVLSEQDKAKTGSIPLQSKIFLVNLLFEYVQRGKYDKTQSQYMLMPDLVMKHEPEHEEYEINTVVIVDKNGNIVKIYEDNDKKKEIPFSNKSKITKKLQCEGQVQDLTKEDLYQKLRKSLQSKDYQKIPGFDKSKIPNIPGIKDFDISKLPFK